MCGALAHVRFVPIADIAPVNYGVRYSPQKQALLYFALAQTHSSRKRERSSILIFCCSIRFSHSRNFSALSTGIIFSGAVAFMRSVTCADAACARNIAKVNGAENSVRRCGCTRVSPVSGHSQRTSPCPLWAISGSCSAAIGIATRSPRRRGPKNSSAARCPWPLRS